MRSTLLFALLVATLVAAAGTAQAKKEVRPDFDAIASWYQERDISTAPALVQEGYNIVHNTTTTIGPYGNVRNEKGEPYVFGYAACDSCHFGGGLVPDGIPLFQVRDKYAPPGLYYRAANVNREVASRINWCLVECANGQFLPEDHPAMKAMVAYINWIAEGITDPNMIGTDKWHNIPGHTWPDLSANYMNMEANPDRGEAIYWNRCDTCHGDQGPGQGRYEPGEGRPRIPPLWGDRSFTRGAGALHTVPNLARGIKRWMPLDDADLSEQEALDVSGFINSQERLPGLLTHTYFTAQDPATGMPNALFKQSYWPVGAPIPGDPFTYEQHLLGPWAPIEAWQKQQREQWLAAHPKP